MQRTTTFALLKLTAASGLFLVAGCSATPPPETGPTPTEQAAPAVADPVPDEIVAQAAESQGLDPEPVVEAKHETEQRIRELDEAQQREFEAMFGSDPLGLARNPENADRYEIPLETNARVDGWLDYFQNTIPERFALYLSRAGRYEEMIRRKLRRAEMPEDFLYLALIESGMNPNAYSRARAVGMWQFISGTARAYDLEVSFWVDERRDPEKATDAAIEYLSDLYDEFGSWYLAAAAYNGGPGRVRRAIRRTGSEDFWNLGAHLRSETRNYVPKLVAAAIIGHDPQRYGFTDIVPDTPIEFDLVEVPDATSFDVLAEAAGTDEESIGALNPEFPRKVTPPDRTVHLRIPPGNGEAFAVAYAAIPPEDRVSWIEHTVTRGQTLGQLASRYGTSVAGIRAANNNVNPRRLQVGQRLVIPRTGNATLAARAGGTTPAPPTEGPVTITVRQGDTLWAISRRYRVSTDQLMAWNNLRSSVIQPGDRLEIRTAGR